MQYAWILPKPPLYLWPKEKLSFMKSIPDPQNRLGTAALNEGCIRAAFYRGEMTNTEKQKRSHVIKMNFLGL